MKLSQLLSETFAVRTVSYASPQAEEIFNGSEHVVDVLDRLPAGAAHKFNVAAPEGSHRPGQIEQQIYVTTDNKVIAREIASGDNDNTYFLLNLDARMLPRLLK
jgi:hypothetical protein